MLLHVRSGCLLHVCLENLVASGNVVPKRILRQGVVQWGFCNVSRSVGFTAILIVINLVIMIIIRRLYGLSVVLLECLVVI